MSDENAGWETVDGLLVDLDGVLYIGSQAIDGAVQAIRELRSRGLPCRFLTNTTTRTAAAVVEKLESMGFSIPAEEVFTPVVATRERLLAGRGETPTVHLLLREAVCGEFEGFPRDREQPDYVIVGDIGAAWSYELLNKAFRQILAGAELIAMHKNKYFQSEDGLSLDIGAFVAGLEYVTGSEALVIGKPSRAFFQAALDSLGVAPERAAMVGDDIDSDVGGAQDADLRGILVRTGKYRPERERESDVRPDAVIDSIADLPDLLG